MVKELLLLRHGKSDWAVNTDDFNRPLKSRGKRSAQKIGLWMAQNNYVPEYVISSSAKRAMETSKKACKVMGIDVKEIISDERAYLASAKELKQLIRSCPSHVNRLMLVGHNPGIEQLLMLLNKAQVEIPEDGKIMPTATLAILKFEGEWRNISAHQSQLIQLLRSRELPDTFPFPNLDSAELRERPAYYYSQSAVIPYRFNNNVFEILIVSSNSGKHWVFPKGIIDPGLTPQESAAKEAFEEAGVKGVVAKKLLGEYRVKKWGAECHILVYPMEVNKVIADKDWKTGRRDRKWLGVENVSKHIENTDLLNLLEILAHN